MRRKFICSLSPLMLFHNTHIQHLARAKYAQMHVHYIYRMLSWIITRTWHLQHQNRSLLPELKEKSCYVVSVQVSCHLWNHQQTHTTPSLTYASLWGAFLLKINVSLLSYRALMSHMYCGTAHVAQCEHDTVWAWIATWEREEKKGRHKACLSERIGKYLSRNPALEQKRVGPFCWDEQHIGLWEAWKLNLMTFSLRYHSPSLLTDLLRWSLKLFLTPES